MCHLVPERRLPREGSGRPALHARRVERHHAAEARAKRANHSRKTERAHGKIVVLGKNLDENRPLRCELVFGREGLQGFLRQRHRVLAHHRRFRRIELENDVSLADLDELVERIEQREQVERDLVVRVDLERAFERLTSLRFISRAHQVHAEFGMRPRVLRIERHRFTRKTDRFVEPVVARRELGRDAIDFAKSRIDRERLLGLRVKRVAGSAHIRNRGRQRASIEL